MIKSKAARLIIGSLAPPFLVGLVAGVLGDIVSDKYCQLGDQHCNSYTALLVPLAMVFGVVPSIFYSVLMEFGVREVLVWPRGTYWYLSISAGLGGVAGSISHIPPLIVLGALVGLLMGFVLKPR